MADNLNVVTASGTIAVATDDRSGVHYQRFIPAGGGTGTHGAYSVTTSATAHVTSNASRRYVILQNQGSVNVYYGYSGTIGAGLSNYIAPGDSLEAEVTSSIYLAAASGTVIVTYDHVVD